MPDDVAESAPRGGEHATATAGFGREVHEVRERQFGRRRQAVLDVLVALTEDLQVERKHQGAALRCPGTLYQPLDEIAGAHTVELEPEWFGRMCGHVLDRADAHGGQGERDAELLRRARREDLAVGMLHAGQSRGCKRYRHGDVMAHHLRARAAASHVDRYALAQLDALEVAFIGPISTFGPRAPVGVVVEHPRHTPLREHAQILDAGNDCHDLSRYGTGRTSIRFKAAKSKPKFPDPTVHLAAPTRYPISPNRGLPSA